ncbi:hypothetical protein ACJA25_00830 [Mycoplasmopsis hyopharyngis]|uniref:hypothetical protein n=1 Tax=Mycoplasmopsis hyopharyngis TaxID=29558 RepID=UPI003872A8D9
MKKYFRWEILAFTFVLTIFLFLIGLLTYSFAYKLPRFYSSKTELIVFISIESVTLIPTIIAHILIIISTSNSIKKYKKEHKWFDKSFDDILNFDENKYNYSLSSMSFNVYNSKIKNKISMTIKLISRNKKYKFNTDNLKGFLLTIISISLWKSSEKFENEDDQYNFIMKKLIFLFEKRFNYSIEYIKQKYNELLNIK